MRNFKEWDTYRSKNKRLQRTIVENLNWIITYSELHGEGKTTIEVFNVVCPIVVNISRFDLMSAYELYTLVGITLIKKVVNWKYEYDVIRKK